MTSNAWGPFRPSFSASIAAGTTHARVFLGGAGRWVRATNASNATAVIGFGDDRASAPPVCEVVVPAGRSVLVQLPVAATHVGAVLGSGPGGIFLTRGERADVRCL
jgi:hypothetical protein